MTVTLISDLMTKDLVTLSEDDDFVSADQLMRLRHVRHLPVLRGRQLVGLVTHRDLITAQARMLWSVPPGTGQRERAVTLGVKEVMRTEVVTCAPITPADDAVRLMLEKRLGCILVTREGELVGIVTEADVVKWAVEVLAKNRFA